MPTTARWCSWLSSPFKCSRSPVLEAVLSGCRSTGQTHTGLVQPAPCTGLPTHTGGLTFEQSKRRHEATAVSDGCGLAQAYLHPIEGGEQIARAYVEIAERAANLTILERTVNGWPGLVAQLDGVTVTVCAFDVAGDRMTHIWAGTSGLRARTRR
jgi:hypothetical protein